MTDDEFRAAINALDLPDKDAGRVLGCDPRTIRRWMSGERSVPEAIAKLVRLMLDGTLTVEEVENA